MNDELGPLIRSGSLSAHAHWSQNTAMALVRGAPLVNLLANRSIFNQFRPCVAARSFSDKGLAEPAANSAPETTNDHLIYTQEHFALKESLRKVRRTASICKC